MGGDITKMCLLRLTPSGTSLKLAILSSDVDAIERWEREYGSRGSARRDAVIDRQGEPPVLLAVEQACQAETDGGRAMATVQCLLKLGFSPNARGKTRLGHSPIYTAVCHGRADLVRLLISAGGDVGVPSTHGQTPVVQAAILDFVDCLQVLLEAGADPNTESSIFMGTALHMVVSSGSPATKQMCSILFRHGTEVNKTNRTGRTPLCAACGSRRDLSDVIGFLLDSGADLDLQDNEGCTALMRAVKVANVTTARFLVERGAVVTLTDKEGRTAADIAASVSSLRPETILSIFGQGKKSSSS